MGWPSLSRQSESLTSAESWFSKRNRKIKLFPGNFRIPLSLLLPAVNVLPPPGRAWLFCCVGSPRVPPAAFLPGLAPEDFRRSSWTLSVGRFFVGGSAGAPVALLPHIDVALLDPFARQPDVARMRTRPPMAGHPNPLAAPVPVAGNEIPKRRGPRWRGNDIFPVRRWRLGGLSGVGAVRRSDLRRNGNGTFDHATRWQQQAGGHQETFGWNGIFHGFKFGTSRENLVHFPENATD